MASGVETGPSKQVHMLAARTRLAQVVAPSSSSSSGGQDWFDLVELLMGTESDGDANEGDSEAADVAEDSCAQRGP